MPWAPCRLTTPYLYDSLPNYFWEFQVWKQIEKFYVRENLPPVFEIISQICGWLNLTLMLLCGYGFWMFFFAGSRAANMHPFCRSAKGKNNCVLPLNAKVKTEVGASFGQIHQALSIIAGRKRPGNLRNSAAWNRAITHKNSRKRDKYSSVVIFLSPLPSVLSP